MSRKAISVVKPKFLHCEEEEELTKSDENVTCTSFIST